MNLRLYHSKLLDLFKVKNDYFTVSVLLFVLSFIFDAYYGIFIVDISSGMGYILKANFTKFILAKIGLFSLLFTSYFIFFKSQFVYVVFSIFTFLFYLPIATLFAFSDGSFKPFLCTLFFISVMYLSTMVKVEIPKFKLETSRIDIFLLAISIAIFIVFYMKFGNEISLTPLLIEDVYSIRDSFSAKLSVALNYVYHNPVKAILPCAFIHFLARKKICSAVIILLILLYLYLISGNKIVYFSIFILLFFYYTPNDILQKLFLFLTSVIIALFLFPFFEIFDNKNVLIGTFVDRFLFIPALLTQWYFEYFDGNPFYFAESHLFKLYFQSPFDLPVGYQISKIYLHTTGTYANNGAVCDGFMNLGYIGVAINALIIAFIVGIIASVELQNGYFGLYFMFIYFFLSAPLLSCFFTGGLLVFFIMSIFIRDNKSIQVNL